MWKNVARTTVVFLLLNGRLLKRQAGPNLHESDDSHTFRTFLMIVGFPTRSYSKTTLRIQLHRPGVGSELALEMVEVK